MEYSDYIIYVDESGDHNLIQTNPNYPIFALAFCIFEKQDYLRDVVPRLQELKFRWFGHDGFVLHERELRKREKPFDTLHTRARHQAFMGEISQLVDDIPMTVIAAVIRKDAHRNAYADPANPYELALRFCIERTVHFLRERNQTDKLTHILVECRGANEDRDLELEFRRICANNQYHGTITSLDVLFVDKKSNSTGLQIADLIARPIGLSVLRPDQQNQAYQVIERKFRRGPENRIRGYGLKIFP